MKSRLNRDEQGFSKIPENSSRKSLTGRQPSDLIQTEIEHPMMNLQNFKPALDEFLKYGPSSNVEKVKNLAAEIAAMSAQLDPSRISTEIDNSMGIGTSQNFGMSTTSRENSGFSINSFTSLVDFGELDENKSRRNLSWQQSVNEIMPPSGETEKYHKEYKVWESNDTKRLTSKDWMIDYSMNTQTFAPTHEAAGELTNNVVTYVQLNDSNNPDYTQPQPVLSMPQRPDNMSDLRRQMSVDIKTASIGLDPDGRLATYELITTNLQMQPSHHNSDQAQLNWDPDPLPPHGYKVGPIPANNGYQHQQNNGDSNEQHNDDAAHLFAQQAIPGFASVPGFPSIPGFPSSNFPPQGQLPPTILEPQTSLESRIDDLSLVVPKRAAGVKMSGAAGIIPHHEITDGDVLLERGGKGNHHKGSRYYRRLINERRESYQELPDASRAEKMAISLSVVMSCKAAGARFIHKKKGEYNVMSDREARNKISQALREKKERVMLDA